MSNLKRMLPFFIGYLAMAMGPESSRAGGPGSTAEGSHYRVDPVTVQRSGAGYRYPQAGWIVLHIEGDPYERGFQHGRLMAPEIGRFIPELARYRSTRAPADAWKDLRLLADALFLRRFDAEYREEMKGIADGAAAAGATFEGRPVDFLDIVTINADIETNFLEDAMEATATGLEGRQFREPADQGSTRPRNPIAAPSRPPDRPPPTARSSLATSPCGTSSTPTTTTSGSTSSRPGAIAFSCRPTQAAS